MDSLTLVINSATTAILPPSKQRFTITVDRRSTVQRLKELILTHITSSESTPTSTSTSTSSANLALSISTTTVDHLSLLYQGHTLDNDQESIESALKTRIGDGSAVELFVSVSKSITPASRPSQMSASRVAKARTETGTKHHSFPSTSVTSSPHIASFLPPPYTIPLTLVPYKYAIINGMPYLIPTSTFHLLQYQQQQQHTTGLQPPMVWNTDASLYYHFATGVTQMPSGPAVGSSAEAHVGSDEATGTGTVPTAAVAPARNPQEIAARDQRRAAALWLLLKLAFGVYLFSQNGSIERIILLHLAALIIFLHQTGRLRIVRRIANPPQQQQQQQQQESVVAPASSQGSGNSSLAPEMSRTPSAVSSTLTSIADPSGIDNNATVPLTANALDDSRHSGSSPTAEYSSSSEKQAMKEIDSLNTKQDSDLSATVTKEALSANAATNCDHPPTNQEYGDQTSSSSSLSPSSSTPGPETMPEQTQNQGQGQEQGPDQQPRRQSTWRSLEHALLTFITSLIPAPPPPEMDPAAPGAAPVGDRVL